MGCYPNETNERLPNVNALIDASLLAIIISSPHPCDSLSGETVRETTIRGLREMNNHITKPIDIETLKDNGYTVSECGEVISLKGRAYRVLKAAIGNHGYKVVNLRLNGRSVVHSVHRLVCLWYHPAVEGAPLVNHKDGDKLNNHRSNLEWVTHSQNMGHAEAMGLYTRDNGKFHKV